MCPYAKLMNGKAIGCPITMCLPMFFFRLEFRLLYGLFSGLDSCEREHQATLFDALPERSQAIEMRKVRTP